MFVAADSMTRQTVLNTRQTIAQMVRVAVLPPRTSKRWQHDQGLRHIRSAEDAVDALEWRDTHAMTNVFGIVSPTPECLAEPR